MMAKTEIKEPIDIDIEIKTIEAISEQVKNFAGLLGEKANTEDFDSLRNEISELSENLKTWTDKEVLKSIESINKKNENIHDQIVEMQEKLAEQNDEKSGDKGSGQKMFDSAELKSFVDSIFPQGKNEPKSRTESSFELKIAEIFGMPQTIVSGSDASALTGRYIDPTLYQRRRKTNLILDYFNIQTITVPTLIYISKVEIGPTDDSDEGDPGGAEWLACGDKKPMRSFRIETEQVEAKKLAIFGTIDDCLLQDVSSFENWIRQDFLDEMKETYNTGLLTGNSGDSTKPIGLLQNAMGYTATTAFTNTILDPNYIDAIIAAIAFQASKKEKSAYAFISTDVFYAIHALKSSDAKWLNNNLVYTNSLGQLFIAGVEVIPVDDEDIGAANLLLVGAEVGFKILNYGGVTFERGLNDEDFRYDRTSYRAYQRVLSYIPEHREASVIYDTWATILSAIEVPDTTPEQQ